MKKRSLHDMRGLLSILLPGGVAALVVARTLAIYWARDWTASLIVVAMAVALVLGLLELLVRQARAEQLDRELHALPAAPKEFTLDSATPLLQSLLRARLEQAPLPSVSEGIAPFLSGLLVMLGLLGTLLGLFQTVHGAGHALTSSADVDALRRSLSGPIDGLTRSFGCSAAGISASAMLGLAIALVRRQEAHVLRAIFAYASGPLRALSPSVRQTRAIELIANQGNALPAAAEAIERVGEQLSALSTQLVSLQQAALEAQQRAFRDLLASVHGEFAKAAGETGKALHARVSPLLEQMATRSGEALLAQSNALADVARQLTHELERDAGVRRSEAAEALQAMRVRLDEAEAARAAAHAKELSALTGLHARTLSDAAQHEQALSAHWQELVARFDTQLSAARESEAERLRQIDAQLGLARESEAERLRQIDAQLSAARESEAERLRQIDAQLSAARESETERLRRIDAQLSAAHQNEAERLRSLDAQVSAAHEREGDQLARLDELRARIGRELERLSAALSAQLEKRLANEQSQDARAERAVAQLAAAAGAVEQGITRQEAALERLVERLPPLFDRAAASSQQAAQHALAQLVELTEQRLASVSSVLSDEVTQRSAAARTLDERVVVALARVDRSAESFDGAIARQASGLEALVARVETTLPELADAAQAGAASTLKRLHELAEQQAARFAELEASLERGREQHASQLAEQLTSHAAELEQRLTKTSDAVQEAAAIWQASSAEMQAVAELFATSIERQREASEAWLASLGEIEGAVDRAGRHAASDALTDQLASTQELFARQLHFQRELFEQLRTLRAGASTARAQNGEHDVSVGE